MRLSIVDDEKLERKRLSNMIQTEMPEVTSWVKQGMDGLLLNSLKILS